MLRQLVPVIILVFIKLLSVTSSQSCICNELLAALEELEHRDHPNSLNQSGSGNNIVC